MTQINREAWLQKATKILAKDLFKPLGYEIPPIKVSTGFTGSRKKKAIGSCWSPDAADDNVSQIFISPVINDSIEVLATLCHELIHAIFPECGHRGAFIKAARSIGLTGKMTATTAGLQLRDDLNALTKKIGQYPHALLNVQVGAKKKQATRLLKAECSECGYTIRLTKKWAEIGLPTCLPECGGDFFLVGATEDDA